MLNQATGGPFTVSETVNDGVFDIDAPEQVTATVGTVDYFGTNANGDVAVAPTGAGFDYFLYSNQSYANGFTVPSLVASDRAVVCFDAATMIATSNGEQRVDALQIGDLVRTADGRDVPIKWIGRQTIAKLFARENAQLVRISAGVLDNHADLYVTADHGMVLGGYVVNASALVNRETIDYVSLDDTPDSLTVYHVETEAHDVVLANGAPSETFVDGTGRAMFDNYAEYLALYGVERIIPEMTRPRITTQRLLPDAIKARLEIVGTVQNWSLSA